MIASPLSALGFARLNVTGRIVDIRPHGVILDAPEGRVLMPAATVNDSISVLVGESE